MKSSKNSTSCKINQTQNSLLNRRSALVTVIDSAGGAAFIAPATVSGESVMQMETTLLPSSIPVSARSIISRIGRNRLLVGGAALSLIAAGLIWQWSWLVAIGVAPLLLSAAPCVAMCALGLCMHRMSGPTGAVDNRTSETPSPQQEN
jgi:hypothetical protein